MEAKTSRRSADMRAAKENSNNNNTYRYYGTKNNNQSEDQPKPASPLVGDGALTDSVAKAGALAEEILNFFSSGDDANKNATPGTNVLLSEGFQGFDPLIAVKDCSCKTPLLDALKKQTEALAREKEGHDATRAKRIMFEREAMNLRTKISDFIELEREQKAQNGELHATIDQLKAGVEDKSELARNSETLVERIRSELVMKHGELAREVQRAKKAEADVTLLEDQVETLQRQVSEYDEERMRLERGRNDAQSRFVESVAKFKSLKMQAEMEKDELFQNVAAMRIQVKTMSQQKTAAERECRSYRERVEALLSETEKDKAHIRGLEDALTKEATEHESKMTGMTSEIARLEQLLTEVKSKAQSDVAGLDQSRGQCNNLLMRATKEIAHLDQTAEDMKQTIAALNDECQSLKEEKKLTQEEAKTKEERCVHEMERLSYEINRLGEVNSEMDEARNEAEVRILELENALENAKRLLQVRDQEAEALEAAMQKRTEALNNAVKGATEKMHEEIASVKATLRAKSAELQDMKSAVNAAGGLVSLMPLDRDDYQQALRESAELKRENAELTDELRRSSEAASKLQSELNNALADADDDGSDDDDIGGDDNDGKKSRTSEKVLEDATVAQPQRDSTRNSKEGSPRGSKGGSPRGSKAAETEQREARLTADLAELQGRLNELQEALTAAEAEVEKLTSILKESLQAKPMDIHAEMYEKQMTMNAAESSGVNEPFEASTEAEAAEGMGEAEATTRTTMTPNNPSLPPPSKRSADSLQALTHQVKMARNYQLKKGIGEAMQRVGLDNAELQNLARTYEGQHVDFNQTLEEIVRKAAKYRAEKIALANSVKELKVENHFMKLELTLYKELEIKMKEIGSIDEEALKNAKVDVAERVAKSQQPQSKDLDPDVAAAVGGAGNYPKSSIVQMTTMFAEQKHILDVPGAFQSLDDLLKALREDITTTTRALKMEIQSMTRMVDSMMQGREGGEANVHAFKGGRGGCLIAKKGNDDRVNDAVVADDVSADDESQRNDESLERAVESASNVVVVKEEAQEGHSSAEAEVSGTRASTPAPRASAGSPRRSTGTPRASTGTPRASAGARPSGAGANSSARASTGGRRSSSGAPTAADQNYSAFARDRSPARPSANRGVRATGAGSTRRPSTASSGFSAQQRGSSRRSGAAPQTPDVVVENVVDTEATLRADLDATADPARNSSNNSISCLNHKLPPHLGYENRHGRFCNDGIAKRECQDGIVKTQFPKKNSSSEDVVQRHVPPEVDRRDGRGGFETRTSSSFESEAVAHQKRSAAASRPQHPQHRHPREVDEQGNTWLTDEAGRRWVIDEAGRQWRLGSDGRQYVIDSAGVKWTVQETEGRRRLWRCNDIGEHVYAEEDGVEKVVNDARAARRRDEAGNEVVKDADGLEWILDDAGRRWRENEKGQMVLTDENGRIWKFASDGDEKHGGRRNTRFGHRRDALGQKWMIDLEGGVWMVGCDRRAWRVDSNMDILVLETARGRGSSSIGDEARWLVERSTGIQWLVDEKRDRIRAATKKEAIRVPPDVRKALKVEAKAGRAGADEDSDVASSRSGSPVTSTVTTRSKRTRASAESRKRRAKEEEELASERRADKGSGSETLESGEESVSSDTDTDEERRRRKKKSRKTELSGSPSFLRAKADKLRREAAVLQERLTSSRQANDDGGSEGGNRPAKPEKPSYFSWLWGM